MGPKTPAALARGTASAAPVAPPPAFDRPAKSKTTRKKRVKKAKQPVEVTNFETEDSEYVPDPVPPHCRVCGRPLIDDDKCSQVHAAFEEKDRQEKLDADKKAAGSGPLPDPAE